ncbi:MAG TPA: FAD binding domain-containing protein [Propylenella sp.]|nr:FAD binding domain-containing protein [Propylenella sp.]
MFLRPETIDEAVQAIAAHGGQILAGGTDFFPQLGEAVVKAPVVDLSRVAELRGIAEIGGSWRIGARTTWTDVIRAKLPPCFDALKLAAREVGAVQVQNAGTVGGNLCNASPAADGVPPLLILDAEVELASPAGRRRLKLDRFITGNRRTRRASDEVLTAVLVPRRHEGAASTFLKLGARRYLVISIAMVAALIERDEAGCVAAARVAVGACSPVAQRLPDLEADLLGALAAPGIGQKVRLEHFGPLSPIADVRATAEYRRDAALILVRRALEACVA